VRVAPLLSLFNIAAWILSGKFLIYEYRKRLSEEFLTHQLYWTLTFSVDAFLTFSNYQLYEIPTKVLQFVRFGFATINFIMMIFTTKRTIENLRPDDLHTPLIDDDYEMNSRSSAAKTTYMQFNNDMRVTLSRKFIFDNISGAN
jgi:hypothetical protein